MNIFTKRLNDKRERPATLPRLYPLSEARQHGRAPLLQNFFAKFTQGKADSLRCPAAFSGVFVPLGTARTRKAPPNLPGGARNPLEILSDMSYNEPTR